MILNNNYNTAQLDLKLPFRENCAGNKGKTSLYIKLLTSQNKF